MVCSMSASCHTTASFHRKYIVLLAKGMVHGGRCLTFTPMLVVCSDSRLATYFAWVLVKRHSIQFVHTESSFSNPASYTINAWKLCVYTTLHRAQFVALSKMIPPVAGAGSFSLSHTFCVFTICFGYFPFTQCLACRCRRISSVLYVLYFVHRICGTCAHDGACVHFLIQCMVKSTGNEQFFTCHNCAMRACAACE